ncbi:hypothetical protein ACJMK2_005317, partial [Sinanodonta woodiana]
TQSGFNVASYKGKLNEYSGMALKYNNYRWIAGSVLSAILTLIISFLVLGIVFGVLGNTSKSLPVSRGCVSHTGSRLLMVTVVFIFIFSSLLMLLTTVSFTVGALLERYVCQGLDGPNYSLLKVMDDQSFLTKMGITARISDVVRNCKEGKTAYVAFQLENSSTMGFNMKQIQDDIDKNKQAINVKLNTTLQSLTSLDPSTMHLDSQLHLLDDLVTSLTGINFTILKTGNKLEEALGHLEALGKEVRGWKQSMNDSIHQAQRQLSVPTMQKLVTNFSQDVFGIVDRYIAFAFDALNNKLGKCTPLWNLYNSLLLVSFCKYTVDAFNGFWFSIGWCIFFFMPGIILAVILEKYFRRMNTVGVIEDSTSADSVMELKHNVTIVMLSVLAINQITAYIKGEFLKDADTYFGSPNRDIIHDINGTQIPSIDQTIGNLNDIPKQTFELLGETINVSKTWRCSGHILQQSLGGCACSDDCPIFRDCCADAYDAFLDATNVTLMRDLLRDPEGWFVSNHLPNMKSRDLVRMSRYGTCTDIPVSHGFNHYIVIDRCPENKIMNCDLCMKCTNSSKPRHDFLVFDKRSQGMQVIYKNIFCALCHGLGQEDLMFLKMHADCPHHMIKLNQSIDDLWQSCKKYYKISNVAHTKPRSCIPYPFKGYCKNSTISDLTQPSFDELACNAYLEPIVLSNQQGIFRNKFCAESCRLVTSKNSVARIVDKVPEENRAPEHMPSGHFVKPSLDLAVIFNFNFISGLSALSPDGRSVIAADTTEICDLNYVYDYAFDTCRPLECPVGLVFVNNSCHNDDIWKEISNSITKPKDNNESMTLSLTVLTQHRFDLTSILHCTLGNDVVRKFLILEASTYTSDRHDFTTHDIQIDIVPNISEHQIVSILKLLSGPGLCNKAVIQNISVSNLRTSSYLYCDKPSHIEETEDVKLKIYNDTYYGLLPKNNEKINLLKARFNITYVTNSEEFMANYFAICRLSFKPETTDISTFSCVTVRINASEFDIQNNTVVIRGTGLRIYQENFEFIPNTSDIHVCANYSEKLKHSIEGYFMSQYIDGENYKLVALICASLSIAFLLLTVLIYSISSYLRTIHGKTLVSLSVSLIVAEGLSFTQHIENPAVCKLVAFVLHTAWLSSFGWMSVISYDMAMTFFVRSLKTLRKRNEKTQYAIYVGFAVGIPLFIVTASLTVDIIYHGDMIGYAQHGFCFITKGLAFLVVFEIPLAISIAFNLLSFGLTVYGICSGRRAAKGFSQSNDRCFCFVYLKLAIVIGSTWVLAFIASAIDIPALWYVHAVLNGLQGVFLCFCFVLNARLWNRFRDMMSLHTSSTATTRKDSA